MQPARCIAPRWTCCNAQPNTVGNPPSYSAICRNAPNISVFPCSGRSGVGEGEEPRGRGTASRSPVRASGGRVRFLPIHPVGAQHGRVCVGFVELPCSAGSRENPAPFTGRYVERARGCRIAGDGVPARALRFGHWGASEGRGAPRGSLRPCGAPFGARSSLRPLGSLWRGVAWRGRSERAPRQGAPFGARSSGMGLSRGCERVQFPETAMFPRS